MAQINHNISSPNDDLGDQLRTAFGNQNTMNTEFYANKVDKVGGKDLSTNDFTNVLKTKLDGIAAGAEVNVQPDWEQADNTADDYIKNKPAELFSSVGSFHYVDLATQTTPLTVVANVEKKITNDAASTETNTLNAPYGISSMYDMVASQLGFINNSIGDLVTIIPAIEVTTTIANQNVNIYIKLGIGSSNPTTKQVLNTPIKAIGSVIINPTSDFVIDTLDIKDYPAEIFILSDAAATVKSGALDIKVIRKDINIVSSDPSKQNKLIAGANITINVTDPLNPIISASGGGGGAETATTLGSLIGGSADATPNDSDFIATSLTAGGILKKITWTNAKAFLKTYFDGVYTTTGAVATQITTALSGYATQSWVTSQGYVLSVITSLGYTPANKAGETFAGAISATNLSGTNSGNETASTIAAIGHAATTKTVLVDADEVTGQNSAASFSLIRTVWSDVWTYIKSKADSVYQPKGIRVTNATTTGSYAIDWNAADVWQLTLTGATTLTDTNLPTGTATKVIELVVKGAFAITIPAYWEATPSSGAYTGGKWNHFVISCIVGTAASEKVIYSNEVLAT